MNRRVGKFTISTRLVQDEPQRVLDVMARCIVIRCEHLWERDVFEYVALCDAFDALPEGCMTPDYAVIAHEGGSVEFRRKQ